MLVSVRTFAITVMAAYFMLIESTHSHLPAGLAAPEQSTPHPTCILGPLCAWFVLYMRNRKFDFSTGFLSGVTKTRFRFRFRVSCFVHIVIVIGDQPDNGKSLVFW